MIPSFPGDPEGFRTADALLLFNPGLICAPFESPTGTTATFDRWMKRALPAGGDERLSPIHHLDAADPPMIVLQSAQDELVPAASVTLFCDTARGQGVACELALFEEGVHGFFNEFRGGRAPYLATLRLADEFLVDLDWLAGPSPAAAGDEPAYRLTGRKSPRPARR